jgi:hypothetical protein
VVLEELIIATIIVRTRYATATIVGMDEAL